MKLAVVVATCPPSTRCRTQHADVNAVHYDGSTAWSLARQNGHEEVANLLPAAKK